jgi:hypothetical protein
MKPARGVALCMGKVPWSMLRSGSFVPFTIIGGCSTDEGHANESIGISSSPERKMSRPSYFNQNNSGGQTAGR